MDLDRTIDVLLESACASIRYRIRQEILHEDTGSQLMLALQDQISQNRMVNTAFAHQKPNGMFGTVFHNGISFDSKARKTEIGSEGTIRFLVEMALPTSDPRFARAIQWLKTDDWHPERKNACFYYPEHNMYGPEFIRAVSLANLCTEDESIFKPHIDHAVQVFDEASHYTSYEQVAEPYLDRGRPRLVFRPGVRFPEIYHLKLLAATYSWREETIALKVQRGLQGVIDLSPLKPVKVLHKRVCLGPATIYPADLRLDLARLGADAARPWAEWLHTFELFARMGMVRRLPDLTRQAEQLLGLLEQGSGYFPLALPEAIFRNWTIYRGTALEDSWKEDGWRWDLTFRSLLILYYAGYLGQRPSDGRTDKYPSTQTFS